MKLSKVKATMIRSFIIGKFMNVFTPLQNVVLETSKVKYCKCIALFLGTIIISIGRGYAATYSIIKLNGSTNITLIGEW